MTLTDLMSGAGLSGFAEAALLLFILAFAAIVFRIFAPGRRQEMDRAAQLPLDDGQASTPRSGSDR
jgi:cbb3-type cytochrome oxidase subunit 3